MPQATTNAARRTVRCLIILSSLTNSYLFANCKHLPQSRQRTRQNTPAQARFSGGAAFKTIACSAAPFPLELSFAHSGPVVPSTLHPMGRGLPSYGSKHRCGLAQASADAEEWMPMPQRRVEPYVAVAFRQAVRLEESHRASFGPRDSPSAFP